MGSGRYLWRDHVVRGASSKGKTGNNHIVLGPWSHSQVNRAGRNLGPFSGTAKRSITIGVRSRCPFFSQYLKDGPPANLPAAIAYNTGEDRWERLVTWPLACERGCPAPLTPIYLNANGGLDLRPGAAGGDSYVSDPAKPVPHFPRPVNFDDGSWTAWLTSDQRSVDGRPDVMTYQTEMLEQPVRVSGAPIADLFARTTGTDGDFVVKLIDVYPVGKTPTIPRWADISCDQPRTSFAAGTARVRASLADPRQARCSNTGSGCRR